MPKPARFSKRTDFYTAQRHAVRAFLRGDPVTAQRWLDVARYRLDHRRTLNDLINHRPIPRPKPRKPKPLPSSMPVMLDPKGFSPGGQPNWYLNRQRLERAGLDRGPTACTPEQLLKAQNRPPTSQRRTR